MEAELNLRDSKKVPTNDVAHLMYYLYCVNICLDGYIKDKKVMDFPNFYSLTNEQRDKVYSLCSTMTPYHLINTVFFNVHSLDRLLKNSPNYFYPLQEGRKKIPAAARVDDSILIEGKKVAVKAVMVFEESWLRTHYFTPISKKQATDTTSSSNVYFPALIDKKQSRNSTYIPYKPKNYKAIPSQIYKSEFLTEPKENDNDRDKLAKYMLCFGLICPLSFFGGAGFCIEKHQRGFGLANLFISVAILTGLTFLLHQEYHTVLVRNYILGLMSCCILVMVISFTIVGFCFRREKRPPQQDNVWGV